MDGYYPVFLKLGGKRALVLGGGPVAARKAGRLVDAGAEVVVVSPELCPELEAMAGSGRVRHIDRKYAPGDLPGAFVLIAATDDPAVNEAACAQAASLGIPANSVRPPSAGSFIVPSSINRGGLTVAISTGGGCPALAKRLRHELEGFIGDEYGPFLEFLEEARARLKASLPDERDRAAALTRLVESGIIERFRAEGTEAGLRRGRQTLNELITSLRK